MSVKSCINKIFGSHQEYKEFLDTVIEKWEWDELPCVISYVPSMFLTLLDIQDFCTQFENDLKGLKIIVHLRNDEEEGFVMESSIFKIQDENTYVN